MMTPTFFPTRIPQKIKAALLCGALAGLFCASATAQTAPDSALLRFDFNGANPWPKAAADVMPSTPIDVLTTIETRAIGTPDKAGSTEPSGALLLKTEVGEVNLPWIATYTSGLLAVRSAETSLTNLSLGLDLWASSARPVIVRLESFNLKKYRSGGLETTISPKAPQLYERFVLDLSSMTRSGAGIFNPTDPHVQLTFEIQNPAWPDKAAHELRIDDVHYSASKP